MSVLVATIIARAAKTLIDDNMVGWSESELYDYYNAGAQAIVTAVPTSLTRREFVPLVAGPAQEIPDDGLSLVAIYYNEVSGQILNQVGLELQNQSDPRWPVTTPEVDAVEYMTDVRTPRLFFVNPPNDGTGSVLMAYSYSPAPVTEAQPTAVIPFTDIYQNPLWAFILALAYAKNSKRTDIAKSQYYLGLTNQFLGLRDTAKIAIAPKLDNAEPM